MSTPEGLAKARASLKLPHIWEGNILRLKYLPDGGGQFQIWGPVEKAWFPTDLGDKFMAASIATPEQLRAAGVTEKDLAD